MQKTDSLQKFLSGRKWSTFFLILVWTMILLGIGVRILVFFQNRNLFIDEANLARNIYERGFFGLIQRLSYEQYAPPAFLWGLELFTNILGYGEKAFRLLPLLSGIGSLLVFFFIGRKLINPRALWYPLGLLSVSFIMIQYSTELKQYTTDMLVALSLVLLALSPSISIRPKKYFFGIWLAAGSMAIWSSMPSVFILAAVGFYFLLHFRKEHDYSGIKITLLIAALWIGQFALYYFLLLRPQINSDYLQNYHEGYFLFAWPDSMEELWHNFTTVSELMEQVGGYTVLSVVFNWALFFYGSVIFLKKKPFTAILILAPIVLTLVAASLNQFSLIPRVSLFLMPFFLIVIGYGLHQLLSARWLVVVLLLICARNIHAQSMVRMAWDPYQTEGMTNALSFMKKNEIQSGAHLYIHNGARPSFIYYTTIHPSKEQWAPIANAHLLQWNADYEKIARNLDSKSGLIFTSVYPDDLKQTTETMKKYNEPVAQLEQQGCHAFVYLPKSIDTSVYHTQ